MKVACELLMLCVLFRQVLGITIQRRMSVLESRFNGLEMRVNMDAMQTKADISTLVESISFLNASQLDNKDDICLPGNVSRCDEMKETLKDKHKSIDVENNHKNTKKIPNIVKAFKNEKMWLRQEVNMFHERLDDLDKTLKSVHNSDSKINQVGKALDEVVEDANTIKAELKKHKTDSGILELDRARTINSLQNDFKLLKIDLSDIHESVKMLTTKMDGMVTCEDGWTKFESFRYIVVHSVVNYYSARHSCKEMGATVVDIQTRHEMDFLTSFVGDERIWLGMTDSETEGHWKWDRTNTQVAVQIVNWRSGQPDNLKGNQDCAIAGWRSPRDQWNDQTCSLRHKFVCKKAAH